MPSYKIPRYVPSNGNFVKLSSSFFCGIGDLDYHENVNYFHFSFTGGCSSVNGKYSEWGGGGEKTRQH